jgi:DNA repair exonuclease SbcCD nuclease subunit
MEIDDIIVVAGDIVHAKTDMTPEVIEMTQKFLKSLADLLPTIVIPGNHDANLNNPSRMDAIQPIVNALNHNNLFYLKDSGVWQTLNGDYTFTHQSVFDDAKGFIPSSEIKDSVKIALFHGAVDKIQTEHGFEIENHNINADSFAGYDMVLLGDIHVPNNAVNGNKLIMYPGSLIMQNHSESLYPNHGLLVWDSKSCTHEFVAIENDFGYVTVDVDEGVIVNKPKFPTKSRMRIRVKDTKQSD